MALLQLTPRRIAPYLVSGASGVHILARMWRLTRMPASTRPLHIFLLRNSDIIVVLVGGPVIHHLANRNQAGVPSHLANGERGRQPLILQISHDLRQVFAVLLIGLGIIRRRTLRQQTDQIPQLVERLQRVIAEGIQAVNKLDPPNLSGTAGSAGSDHA
jgi:hypothetical protein